MRPRAMISHISSPASRKRRAMNISGEASARAPLTITKVTPQKKVAITRSTSAFVRLLKSAYPLLRKLQRNDRILPLAQPLGKFTILSRFEALQRPAHTLCHESGERFDVHLNAGSVE